MFEFKVVNIAGFGLSRTVTAELSNRGNADAHNVRGEVQVFSGDTLIKIGGEESINLDIGTIAAGETSTAEITLSFSLNDGLKISQKGARVVLNVYSDESTDTFSYLYNP